MIGIIDVRIDSPTLRLTCPGPPACSDAPSLLAEHLQHFNSVKPRPCIDSLMRFVFVRRLRPYSTVIEGGRGALGFPLYRGSWIFASVGLSDASSTHRVELCDTEMEKDGGRSGGVKADCLSVMNINGLRASTLHIWPPALLPPPPPTSPVLGLGTR